ncbi:MAG: LysM domain-containing protein, partial [Opitutae bacterium]
DMDKLEKKFFTSLEDMQKQMNRALNDVASAPTNAAPPSSPPSSGNSSTSLDYSEFYEHVVVSGDTIYGIHRQYKQYNVRLEDIFAANDLNKNSKLKVGQKLILPIRK